MAKYPAPTSKVLNPSGHVPMKEQMALAARPHTHFQEGGAAGTRSVADITHGADGGMKNGGSVKKMAANVGNIADPKEPDADDGTKGKFGGFGKK